MLHLGSIGKTSIDVDFSFFILVGLFVILNYNEQKGIEYALIWIPILFVSVLFHEFAHAAAIGVFGFGASHIVLGGMGGHTANENMRNARPWQDVVISVAGPISNFLLALACWYFLGTRVGSTDKMLVVLLPTMAEASIWWGMLNLIPVPPLDGGHATRSFFRMFLTDRTSFVISTWIALIVGGAVALWGFREGQFFLAFFLLMMLFAVWQRWQYFREHGIPGD
ncbi:MAG: site-2 protease family protein [Thermoanaerobaculia bacterium]